jgi:hypothetical protein
LITSYDERDETDEDSSDEDIDPTPFFKFDVNITEAMDIKQQVFVSYMLS